MPVAVDVCVCTFRRSSIAATLASLAAQVLPDDVRLHVIVADNDDRPTARDLVETTARELGLSCTYVFAPSRNISLARNACLDAAAHRWMAFIDDDEVAEPSWLATLIATAERSGATAVFGPVRADYPGYVPSWMTRADFHSMTTLAKAGRFMTGTSGNVLIDRLHPAMDRLRFAPRFGRSGGEDTDFFMRLTDRGARIAIAPDAVVREAVTAERASFGWLARRRLRSGQTYGRLLGENTSPFARVKGALLASAKAGFCLLTAALLFWDPVRWRRWTLRGVLHIGSALGFAGVEESQTYGN